MPRTSPKSVCHRDELVIPSDTAEVHRLQKRLVDRLQACRFDEEEIYCIKLAVEEAVINAIKHGNQFDRGKTVRVTYRIDGRQFYVRICDEGTGFDPGSVPDPCLQENIERPCGRGLLLMRHYMSDVQFLDNGHTVVMSKRRAE
jgi:serine/threonine-protein kinase RsbW